VKNMSNKQGTLCYYIESEATRTDLTGLAGLAPCIDLACASGLVDSIGRNLEVCGEQGWTDAQVVMSLILLNLAGGECVDDLNRLEADAGFGKLLRWCEDHGLSKRVRHEMSKRWRKDRQRNVVSASVARRFLSMFHDVEQENLRTPSKAFIPKANVNLLGLRNINAELVNWVQQVNQEKVATLDLDATLIETSKSNALYCYKHYQAYQPTQVYWAEQDLLLHSEFRDGNVPASFEQLRVLKEALDYLPAGVSKVRVRSDSAGYLHNLLSYCEMKENSRFGRIEFAISCSVSPEFLAAVESVDKEDWHPVYREVDGRSVKTKREWAEVCFVPNAIAFSNNAPVYRYMATREALADQPLPGLEAEQLSLPFQTMTKDKVTYKIFGLVTNLDWDGNAVITFLNGRCGKCEEAHKILKEDFAGGVMPSKEFGANAAWWAIAVLSMNLMAAMKRVILGGSWCNRRMKAIRFLLINVTGRVISKSRQLYLRLSQEHPALELFVEMRQRILKLAESPPLPA
jgi:hypothetical protein